MKNLFLIFAATLFLGIGTAYATNITIPDKNSAAETGWYGMQEDDEVEPGMAQNQAWDLEGFFLNGKMLSLVGGYDFQNGAGRWNSGDIFIDINGDAVYGDIHEGTKGNHSVQETYGYDYAIDLYWTGDIFSYNVFELDSDTWLQRAFYHQNQGSSPWRYESGGNQILNEVIGQYTANASGYDTFSGDWHNELIVDLSFLPKGSEFIAHFTMGCGNDNIMGQGTTPNPEPATMVLLGFGLIGIAGLYRKKL